MKQTETNYKDQIKINQISNDEINFFFNKNLILKDDITKR